MSDAVKKLMVRVIKNKMKTTGRTFDEVILDYPKLTAKEIEELRIAVAQSK